MESLARAGAGRALLIWGWLWPLQRWGAALGPLQGAPLPEGQQGRGLGGLSRLDGGLCGGGDAVPAVRYGSGWHRRDGRGGGTAHGGGARKADSSPAAAAGGAEAAGAALPAGAGPASSGPTPLSGPRAAAAGVREPRGCPDAAAPDPWPRGGAHNSAEDATVRLGLPGGRGRSLEPAPSLPAQPGSRWGEVPGTDALRPPTFPPKPLLSLPTSFSPAQPPAPLRPASLSASRPVEAPGREAPQPSGPPPRLAPALRSPAGLGAPRRALAL